MLSGSWVGSVHVGRLEELEPSAWRAPLPPLYLLGREQAGGRVDSPGAQPRRPGGIHHPRHCLGPTGLAAAPATWAAGGLGRQQLEL